MRTLCRLTLVSIAVPPLLLSPVEAREEAHDVHEEPRLVRLSPRELDEFGIELATAGAQRIEIYASLPGEVRPNADRLAHIVPRYSGIVLEVRARIGDRVARGDVLAVIESDNALAPFDLRTLIDGTVIAKHITRGEAVSRDTDCYVIADLSTVWVDLTVYQRDIERIRTGQKVFLYTGHGPVEAAGIISYVTPVLDERTRTATARAVLPNSGGTWRPGMFVTAQVLVDTVTAPVAVPRTAVHTLGDHPVVFVRTEAGFHPAEVVLGREDRDHVTISSGLEPGARYVSVGGFTLKAELGKSAFGHGHAH